MQWLSEPCKAKIYSSLNGHPWLSSVTPSPSLDPAQEEAAWEDLSCGITAAVRLNLGLATNLGLVASTQIS